MDTEARTPDQNPGEQRVRDKRPRPSSSLPASLQTWVMLGAAVIIIAIVLTTSGTPSRSAISQVVSPTRATTQTTASDFRARLEEQDRRLAEARRQLAEQQAALEKEPDASTREQTGTTGGSDPAAAIRQEQIRRDYDALFADQVVYSVGQEGQQRSRNGSPTPSTTATIDPALVAALTLAAQSQGATRPPVTQDSNAPSASPASETRNPPAVMPASRSDEPGYRLMEGTIVEAALTTRLNGEFAGRVEALVTTPVLSRDGQHVLVPQGSRLLGEAHAVTAADQQRLAVSFHRLIWPWPENRSLTLEGTPALNQIGETGLRDQIDHHYALMFGSALAIAGIEGLANSGFGLSRSTGNTIVINGAGLQQPATRVLDRFLNQPPTRTIREGHRLRVMLTGDVDLPAYRPGFPPSSGAQAADIH